MHAVSFIYVHYYLLFLEVNNVTSKASNERPPRQAFEVSFAHRIRSLPRCSCRLQGQCYCVNQYIFSIFFYDHIHYIRPFVIGTSSLAWASLKFRHQQTFLRALFVMIYPL